ncbi:alpha/beta fold hydrolase [Corynebacterium sp. 320]|uniref:esterase/lipase family protein n=1 Tax=Corynebacterium TaxID=1716 RepID=UPI00125CB236|nr:MULTISPECIES: alpha/beta fold hydrolase [Corynebacterium]KAB1504330.1 alpha/beta fold hydrolase [Corynebacterium sp. 320]KAB1552570.1 alpha/beta fold hydrolase [Corynebacterium sp. 321]KAB3528466.1 alpha/beta fold hydrolase [Corynebacterium sp. 250]QNP92006.1 alpha/beta fold hydrolase [Corynebacterium zhongnanshanii]
MDAFIPKFLKSVARPNPLPEGVNQWDEPLNGRVPVILIHGTWLNAYNTFDYLARHLIETGHAVFAVNYGKEPQSFVGKAAGVYANNFLREAYKEVIAFVREVLERTGAEQVDLVGHSQGVAQCRMVAAEFAAELAAQDAHEEATDGLNPVRRIVGLGPAHHGTTLSGVSTLAHSLDRGKKSYPLIHAILGGAATDQAKGSEFGEYLNKDGDTVPGVEYTMITTKFDGIATPWRDQIMVAGEGAVVYNIGVQDEGNIFDWSSHLSMLYSPRVVDLVKEALHPDAGGRAAYRTANPYKRGVVVPMMGAVHRPRFPRRRR